MPETLPGDPTEAGPTSRRKVKPPQGWDDLELDAIGELQFAIHHYGFRTKADIQMQRAANIKAINLLMDAAEILKDMELGHAIR